MSEQTPDEPPADGDLGEQTAAPPTREGTDISADDLDVSAGAGGDRPATSDPEAQDDDGSLGGVGGESPGGAG